MASSAFTGRSDGAGGAAGTGLAAMATNLRVKADDFNQSVRLALACSRMLKVLTGGEGILTGGATLIGDFGGGGTTYPAVTLLIADDVGDVWPIATTSATTITFSATSGSGVKLYATPTLLTGITPSMADGKPQGLTLIAKASGDAAPAHSLLLGAGDVTASAFTTWTEDAGARIGNVAHLATNETLSGDKTLTGALDVEGALTLLDGGSNHDITIARADVAAARTYTLPEAGAAADFVMTAGAQTLTGDKTFNAAAVVTNGRLRNVRAAKFGPPTTGTYVTGDLWLDAAGSLWYCTAGASPGTWAQASAGLAATWTGGGATDIKTAGNWNGGALLDGYRVSDGEHTWVYDTGTSKWRSSESFTVQLQHNVNCDPLSANTFLGCVALSDSYDVEILRWSAPVHVASESAGISWKISLLKYDTSGFSSEVDSCTREAAGYYAIHQTPGTVGIAPATYPRLAWRVDKTGSPGNLTVYGCSVRLRWVR